MRDREGQTFEHVYNSRNLPMQVTGTNAEGTSVKTYTYNAAGQVTSATVDGLTFTNTYHPDDGSLVTVTYPDNRSTTVNRYVDLSRSEIIDPFGQKIHYVYDNRGRLDYITLGTLGGAREVDYAYTANSKVANLVYNGGLKQEYAYGAGNAHMLHTITHRASHNSLLNQYTYGYDETFNITTVGSKTDPQSSVVNHSFTYDAVDRIKTSTDGNESYDYDNRGNRLTMPSIGRFITEDTYEGELTSPLTLNLYTYVENNPLKYIDPSGNIAIFIPAALFEIGKAALVGLGFVATVAGTQELNNKINGSAPAKSAAPKEVPEVVVQAPARVQETKK